MKRTLVFSAFLLSCLAFSLPGCSLHSTKKVAKQVQPQVSAAPQPIEWKDRKWESYAEERDVTYYFEKESISYPAKDLVHVWRKRIFSAKSSHKVITSLDEIDCRNERFRSLEVQGLSWDDTTTPVYKRPTPWVPIYTDTPDDYFLIHYCRQGETSSTPSSK
jgi:hypothetical protein